MVNFSYFTAERRPAIGRLSWLSNELFSVGFGFGLGRFLIHCVVGKLFFDVLKRSFRSFCGLFLLSGLWLSSLLQFTALLAQGFKAINTTSGVYKFLLSGIKRVAVRANFHGDFWHGGVAGKSSVATEAGNLGFDPIWMDIGFHNPSILPGLTAWVKEV